jgi:hypothetical protein
LACFPAAEMKKADASAFSYNRKREAGKGGYAGQAQCGQSQDEQGTS